MGWLTAQMPTWWCCAKPSKCWNSSLVGNIDFPVGKKMPWPPAVHIQCTCVYVYMCIQCKVHTRCFKYSLPHFSHISFFLLNLSQTYVIMAHHNMHIIKTEATGGNQGKKIPTLTLLLIVRPYIHHYATWHDTWFYQLTINNTDHHLRDWRNRKTQLLKPSTLTVLLIVHLFISHSIII